jgi:hypothetical protein
VKQWGSRGVGDNGKCKWHTGHPPSGCAVSGVAARGHKSGAHEGPHVSDTELSWELCEHRTTSTERARAHSRTVPPTIVEFVGASYTELLLELIGREMGLYTNAIPVTPHIGHSAPSSHTDGP